MKFIKEHKVESSLLFVFLIIFVVGLISIFIMWNQGNGSKYGDRLNGIKNVKISDTYLKKITSNAKEAEGIHSVTAKIEGRIVNVFVKADTGSDINITKKVSEKVLEAFNKKELEYYDVQIYLTEKNAGEESAYPVIGYKAKSGKNFVWTNN